MDKKGFEKIHFAVLVVFIIGVILGYFVGSSKSAKSAELAKENDAMKSKLEDLKKIFQTERFMLDGTVKSVSDDKIIIEAANYSTPFESFPITREAMIGPETQLAIIQQKSPEQFNAEFIEQNASLDQIEVGSLIAVSSDENVVPLEKFMAKKIIIYPDFS